MHVVKVASLLQGRLYIYILYNTIGNIVLYIVNTLYTCLLNIIFITHLPEIVHTALLIKLYINWYIMSDM